MQDRLSSDTLLTDTNQEDASSRSFELQLNILPGHLLDCVLNILRKDTTILNKILGITKITNSFFSKNFDILLQFAGEQAEDPNFLLENGPCLFFTALIDHHVRVQHLPSLVKDTSSQINMKQYSAKVTKLISNYLTLLLSYITAFYKPDSERARSYILSILNNVSHPATCIDFFNITMSTVKKNHHLISLGTINYLQKLFNLTSVREKEIKDILLFKIKHLSKNDFYLELEAAATSEKSSNFDFMMEIGNKHLYLVDIKELKELIKIIHCPLRKKAMERLLHQTENSQLNDASSELKLTLCEETNPDNIISLGSLWRICRALDAKNIDIVLKRIQKELSQYKIKLIDTSIFFKHVYLLEELSMLLHISIPTQQISEMLECIHLKKEEDFKRLLQDNISKYCHLLFGWLIESGKAPFCQNEDFSQFPDTKSFYWRAFLNTLLTTRNVPFLKVIVSCLHSKPLSLEDIRYFLHLLIDKEFIPKEIIIALQEIVENMQKELSLTSSLRQSNKNHSSEPAPIKKTLTKNSSICTEKSASLSDETDNKLLNKNFLLQKIKSISSKENKPKHQRTGENFFPIDYLEKLIDKLNKLTKESRSIETEMLKENFLTNLNKTDGFTWENLIHKINFNKKLAPVIVKWLPDTFSLSTLHRLLIFADRKNPCQDALHEKLKNKLNHAETKYSDEEFISFIEKWIKTAIQQEYRCPTATSKTLNGAERIIDTLQTKFSAHFNLKIPFKFTFYEEKKLYFIDIDDDPKYFSLSLKTISENLYAESRTIQTPVKTKDARPLATQETTNYAAEEVGKKHSRKNSNKSAQKEQAIKEAIEKRHQMREKEKKDAEIRKAFEQSQRDEHKDTVKKNKLKKAANKIDPKSKSSRAANLFYSTTTNQWLTKNDFEEIKSCTIINCRYINKTAEEEKYSQNILQIHQINTRQVCISWATKHGTEKKTINTTLSALLNSPSSPTQGDYFLNIPKGSPLWNEVMINLEKHISSLELTFTI